MKQILRILLILITPAVTTQGHGPTDHGEAIQLSRALAQNTVQLSATPGDPTNPVAPANPETPETPTDPQALKQPGQPDEPTALATPLAVDDGVRVTVLGYHDFSSTKKATEMLIPTEKFREQMQSIKDLGLDVISMEDFLAWKQGKKKIRDQSVVITIDDGWKSVYTEAYPVLKELNFPFTVFLYTNYVDGGSSALTSRMIKEMQKNGCSIGSHSVSHPYPATVKAERAKGADEFASYLRKEMGESRKMLKRLFKGNVNSYAYPGGYVTGEMLPVATEAGYECLFTVIPGKITLATSSFTVPRYVILGTHDYIFRNAINFKTSDASATTDDSITQPSHPVEPESGALIATRLPTISADLSAVEDIDAESIVMRVAGFGKVPATYNAANKTVSWQANRRLRARTCEVSVQWRITGATKYERPMHWVFHINREASYQPK